MMQHAVQESMSTFPNIQGSKSRPSKSGCHSMSLGKDGPPDKRLALERTKEYHHHSISDHCSGVTVLLCLYND